MFSTDCIFLKKRLQCFQF